MHKGFLIKVKVIEGKKKNFLIKVIRGICVIYSIFNIKLTCGI